ncbi:MAG: type 2 lantipeptide synthetase LanM [Symploca sp. SIO2E9]|nr:type 2 lantipeptide synthetase LanM [Symploca sp. SIO2E9]
MKVDSQTLHRWATSAATLDERILAQDWESDNKINEIKDQFILDTWCDIATKGDSIWFDQILDLTEASQSSITTGLPDSPLPSWAKRLPDIISIITSSNFTETTWDNCVPFSHIFTPISEIFHSHLFSYCTPSVWKPECIEDLVIAGLKYLTEMFAPGLYTWFDPFRSTMAKRLGHTRGCYPTFIEWLRRGNFLQVLDKYPVLARFLSVTISQWEIFTAELIKRFEEDRASLIDHLLEGHNPGAVVKISTHLSDRHNGGRCVAILHFENKQSVVYKPRDLSIDKAWSKLLDWMHNQDSAIDLTCPRVLNRRTYGWAEYISSNPCRDENDIKNYFHRSGALLALIHALGGSDIHQENIIAVRDQPVIIDMETLLSCHYLDHKGEDAPHPALGEAGRRITESVLSTGFLPSWKETDGQTRLNGGLGRAEDGQTNTIMGFTAINTDDMQRERLSYSPPTHNHLPRWGGQMALPADYSTEIISGFEQTYRLIMAQQKEFLTIVDVFRNTTIRVVFRDTRFYQMLLERAALPSNLKNGLYHSLEFELLWRLSTEPDLVTSAQILAERRALGQFDIPLFHTTAESTIITEAGGNSFNLNQTNRPVLSPLSHTQNRIKALSQEDLKDQINYVSFALNSNRSDDWITSPWPTKDIQGWDHDIAINRATSLGKRLIELAITREDGACWLLAVPIGLDEKLQLTPSGPTFYDGVGGIAIFLAALAHVTGQDDFREFSLRALAPYRSLLKHSRQSQTMARNLGIGGGIGLGSVVYVLTFCALLFGQQELLNDALRTVELFSDEQIASDKTFDVIGGSAGAILGLLALYKATADPWVLERAMRCGFHLIQGYSPRSSPAPLAGFSHGAAGLDLALDRLGEASGHNEFLSAAANWRAYERNLFHSESNNWLDLRYQSKTNINPDGFFCNWCHGAAGIGLARLDLTHPDSLTQVDINAAISSIISHPMSMRDNLCCGNFGRFEILLQAGLKMNKPKLIALARQQAAIRLHKMPLGFNWLVGTDDNNLGLFQGTAGIGYTLLRLAKPNTLPSVLLWHNPTSTRSY